MRTVEFLETLGGIVVLLAFAFSAWNTKVATDPSTIAAVLGKPPPSRAANVKPTQLIPRQAIHNPALNSK
jgi:hypothetical protein